MDEIRQSRERQSAESNVTILSTLNQQEHDYRKAVYVHTRHPFGTKATGLKRGLNGMKRISSLRDRFGDAEVQSSRLRGLRKSGKHSVRHHSKNDLRANMNYSEEYTGLQHDFTPHP